MPDPVTGLVVGGAQVLGGAAQAQGAKRAGRAQERAAQSGIEEQRAARESFEERTQPFLDIGQAAGSPLLELLGISTQGVQTAPLQRELSDINQRISGMHPAFKGLLEPLEARKLELESEIGELQEQQVTPSPQNQIEQINPVLSFLRQEGFEDIQESAAARGRLGAGGTLQDLTRFNTQLGATIVPQLQQQRFNQLFNVLGLGANTATGQGQAGLQTASNIGSLLGNIGQAQAQTAIGQTNALTGVLGGAAQGLGAISGGGGFNFLGGSPVGGIQNPNQFGGVA